MRRPAAWLLLGLAGCLAVAALPGPAAGGGAGLVAAAGPTGGVRAEGAEPDTAFDGYIRGLSDSTDAWFGTSAAPVDTAGLDSVLAARVGLPPGSRGLGGPGRVRLEWSPAIGFNRSDGWQLGAGLGAGVPVVGRLFGRIQYTTSTKDLLGEGGWTRSWAVRPLRSRFVVRVAGGRWTEAADRDFYDPVLTTFAAAVYGGDRHHYLRRDGFRGAIRLGNDRIWGGLAWRDQLESPLPYSTSWTLLGYEPEVPSNAQAAYGRARELGYTGEVPVPGTRFRVQLGHWTSDPKLGSDFQYRRTTVTTGGDLSLGRHLAFVPQANYGRLRGDVLPQDVFFVGGAPNLRTVERNAWSSSGRVFLRGDVVLVDELAPLLHLPLPAWLPLQLSAYGATGASWGRDPVTNQAVPTDRDWPDPSEWLTEAGATLAWRAGIPDPMTALRFEYSVPIGADDRVSRYTIYYQQPLSLFRLR